MATLTRQTPGEDGGLTFGAAASGGDVFANDGETYFAVTNGGGSSVTVTITAQNTSTTKTGFGTVIVIRDDRAALKALLCHLNPADVGRPHGLQSGPVNTIQIEHLVQT